MNTIRLYCFILLLFPTSGMIFAGLTGSYTIGGINPDYATINDAVSDLILTGVSGPVTFNIRPGTYVEHIYITNVSGTSTANTVIFRSETQNAHDVSITYAGSSSERYSTIHLDGAHDVAFQHLTVRTTCVDSYANAIYIDCSSYNIALHDNYIYASLNNPTYAFSNNAIFYCAPNREDAFILVTNNNIPIGNVRFVRHYYYPKLAVDILYNTINGNLSLEFLLDVNVTGNHINGDCSVHGPTYLSYMERCLIRSNHIVGSMLLSGTYCNPERGIVTNNFVCGDQSASTFQYTSNILLAHNSFVSHSQSAPGETFYVRSSSCLDVLNNLFINLGFGHAVGVFKAGSNYTYYNPFRYCDNNNIYASNGTILAVCTYGYGQEIPTLFATNLSEWQSITEASAHDVITPVSFASHATGDLHLSGSSRYDPTLFGEQATSLTNDIDGDQRWKWMMGADEGCSDIDFVSCPGDISVNTDHGLCTTNATYSVIASGYIPITYTYELSGATIVQGSGSGSGSTFNVGETYVSVTASHPYKSESCDFIITVQAPQLELELGSDMLLTLGYGDQYKVITAQPSGGTPPYTYIRSTAATTESITVSPSTTTTYSVSVTDACGQAESDQVNVEVLDWRCGNNQNKVTLCHNGHTICVAPEAVPAHLDHGDQLGGCQASKSSRVLPGGISLAQNYPNPFNPSTTIEFGIPSEGVVRLRIMDLLGREVAVLVNETRQAGAHAVDFDATNQPSGTYMYQLEWNGQVITRRMTLLK